MRNLTYKLCFSILTIRGVAIRGAEVSGAEVDQMDGSQITRHQYYKLNMVGVGGVTGASRYASAHNVQYLLAVIGWKL